MVLFSFLPNQLLSHLKGPKVSQNNRPLLKLFWKSLQNKGDIHNISFRLRRFYADTRRDLHHFLDVIIPVVYKQCHKHARLVNRTTQRCLLQSINLNKE